MPLNKAQLMEVPGGPEITGAVKQGSGIILDNATGTVNADLNTFCSKIIAGTDIQIVPGSGVGIVEISSTKTIDPNSYLPIGTIMTFFQSGAPPRWITENPGTRMLRINNPTGGRQGGSTDWNSVFTTQTFTGSVSVNGSVIGTTDSVTQTPSGSVSISGVTLGSTSLSLSQIASHQHSYEYRPPEGSQRGDGNGINNNTTALTSASGGSQGHTHAVSGSGGSFSGSSMTHSHSLSGTLTGVGTFTGGSFNFNVQYIDMIVCRKLSNPG